MRWKKINKQTMMMMMKEFQIIFIQSYWLHVNNNEARIILGWLVYPIMCVCVCVTFTFTSLVYTSLLVKVKKKKK